MSQATLHTNAGPIKVKFFADDAPKTVENFRKLAGDVLVAMGTVEALRKLEAMFVPGAARAAGSVLGDLG